MSVEDEAREREFSLHAPATTDERIEQLRRMMLAMAKDVLHVRYAVSPVGMRARLGIVVASAFFGGALANVILWLLGVEPVWPKH